MGSEQVDPVGFFFSYFLTKSTLVTICDLEMFSHWQVGRDYIAIDGLVLCILLYENYT